MKLQKSATILCTLVALSASANVLAQGAVGAKIGTLGAGIEYVHPISSKIAVGIGVNGLSADGEVEESGIKFDADFNMNTVSLLGDFHPWGNGFRISGGLMSNGNKFDLDGTPVAGGESITIGDETYTPDQLGSVESKISFKDTAPYLGIGWGHAPQSGKGFGFDADLGVLFQGSPIVSFTATCGNLSDAQCDELQAEVDKESAQLKTDSEEFDVYPVISVGVSYKF